jgi:hypothetical protein
VPPRIHYVTSNGRVEVKKGSTVKLECRASGNPVPKITWSRKNNVLPSGDQTLQIPVLTLDRVDRHQAGVYKCMANNGVGEDVTQEINLHVLCEYGPATNNNIITDAPNVLASCGNLPPPILLYLYYDALIARCIDVIIWLPNSKAL